MMYLPFSYDPWLVITSLLIASFASYVALDLAKRVRTAGGTVQRTWWVGGSIVMGTGIWCMHFVGMLALSLPIALGYTEALTFASWLAAVVVSAVALFIASRGSLKWSRLGGGALAMGLGICVMHYTGMAALDMQPAIVWDPVLVAASAAIAVGASAAALLIFFWLREVNAKRAKRYQALAALVMGAAVGGMHYMGMAAASFPEGSLCLSAGALKGDNLAVLLTVSSFAMLAITLLTSTLDARTQTARLAGSLAVANAELQVLNDELQRHAFMDPLTRLPNRLLLEDRLAQALRRHERHEGGDRTAGKLAVLFVDLDGFKPVNDLLGHAAGDLVLKDVTQRLTAVKRDSDTLARLGGDEFVLLAEDLHSVADGVLLARRVVEELARPFDIDGHRVKVAGSVGVVVYPDRGQKDRLVTQADTAMYVAKRAGGNTFAVFESNMDENSLDYLSLQGDLRNAVELNQLELYYQPKLDAQLGQIRGVEALLRWNHPVRGVVGPNLFIPIAERFGLINSLGNWVIEEACRQIASWREDGLRMRVAINLSVHQLRQDDLVDRVAKALAHHHVDPSQLLCEITESAAMEDVEGARRAFEGLERIGVFLSIDDFGTGYSSLSHLRQLPARQVKIDRSFINDMEVSNDARAIVSAVIHLAHALGLRVVAEGVETEAQRDLLLALRCDELQGFLFARPMTANTLLEWTDGVKPQGAPEFSPSVIEPDLAI